ncbi:MAG: OmpA family protein [Burkholderiales bacterium]|nr:OmpA family protein [Burkholderiales bacterium]
MLPSLAAAHTALEGYTQFGNRSVVRDGYGGCVRTGDWSADKIFEDCGGPAPAPRKAVEAVPPPPEPRVAAPTPVPAPPPAEVQALPDEPQAEVMPVPVAVPEPAKPTLTLEAEALFDLNKADIRPAAKSKLDTLIASMEDEPYESVLVTGHTDRTGSAAFNRKLSARRAMAVKTYMVSKGVPADKIVAEGRGSSEPQTTAEACGGRSRKALAACLQPDRRVEITVKH